MPKYIDADVLLEQMKLRRFFVGRASDPICIIEDAPAADVEPVKHGRWVETEEDIGWHTENAVECSECGESYILGEWGYDEFKRFMNFCPNCGAKMDREEDHENQT